MIHICIRLLVGKLPRLVYNVDLVFKDLLGKTQGVELEGQHKNERLDVWWVGMWDGLKLWWVGREVVEGLGMCRWM